MHFTYEPVLVRPPFKPRQYVETSHSGALKQNGVVSNHLLTCATILYLRLIKAKTTGGKVFVAIAVHLHPGLHIPA